MKKIIIAAVTIAILGGTGIFLYTHNATTTAPEETEHKEGITLEPYSVSSTITVTGILEPYRETMVAAKIGGRIASMQAEVGDVVIDSTLLAALAGDESSVQLSNAVTEEKNIQSFYSSQQVYLDEQVASAARAVDTAQMNVLLAKDTEQQGTDTLEQKQAFVSTTVAEAQAGLEQTKAIATQRMKSVYSGAKPSFRNGLMAMSDAVDYADGVLEVSPGRTSSGDPYEHLLGIMDVSTRSQVESKIRQLIHAREEYEALYDEMIAQEDISHEQWDTYLDTATIYLEESQDMLKDLYTMFQNTAAIGKITPDMLDGFKQKNMQVATQVEAALFSVSDGVKMGVRGLQVSRDEVQTQNQAEIIAAQKMLEIAKQSEYESSAFVSQMQQQNKNQHAIAQTQLSQAQAAFRATKAQRDAALRDVQTKVDLIRGNKRLSQVAVANTHIGAPYAGIITEKFMEVGQVVAPGQAVFRIMDTSLLKIITDVPDIYANDIYVGMPANVHIDGVTGEYEASISKVYPRVDPVTRKLIIELILHDAPTHMVVGAFSRVSLELNKDQYCDVPRNAVYQSLGGLYMLNTEKKQFAVEIIKDHGTVLQIVCEEKMQIQTFLMP
jgi:multidrug efflux pump subunit AcrA (membrane-fusion protein)